MFSGGRERVHWEKMGRIKKLPFIPPLFHNNEYITDFKEKAELFNSFFAEQSFLWKNESELTVRLTLSWRRFLP